MSLVTPGLCLLLRSVFFTHSFSVCDVQPSLPAIETIVAHRDDFAYMLRVMPMGESARDGNLLGSKSTQLYLALFGIPGLCNNWRALREMLFTPKPELKDFGTWNCRVELDLVSTTGEKAKASKSFQCNRIPVPPPQC
jgi:hypothetical protein